MGFVQAGFLAALGALAIPIVIHLIFRRQTKLVHLGTLRFLKIVLKENSRRRKVKRWLLLAMRMACVALLALLFARPYLIASNLNKEKNRFAAILIDQSASMDLETDGTRLLERAVAEAKEVFQRGGDELQIEVAFGLEVGGWQSRVGHIARDREYRNGVGAHAVCVAANRQPPA